MTLKRSLRYLPLALILLAGAPSFGEGEATDTHVFSVEGMTCALCGNAIEKSLSGVEGVRDVSVDQEAERVTVVTSREVGTASLLAAIESAGSYTAALVEPAGG